MTAVEDLIVKYSSGSALFELLPLGLAVVAIVLCFQRATTARRHQDKVVLVMALGCCLLLLFAQSSWWISLIVAHSLEGTSWANYIWTIFNSLVMATFIKMTMSRAGRKPDADK